MFCVCVPEHLRSEELRHAGRGRCRDDVRSQEKLLGYRGQRPASCLHSCTRARWGRIGGADAILGFMEKLLRSSFQSFLNTQAPSKTVTSCRSCVEHASWWLQDVWETLWGFGRPSPDGACVRQPQQNHALVALQRALRYRILWQRARWGTLQLVALQQTLMSCASVAACHAVTLLLGLTQRCIKHTLPLILSWTEAFLLKRAAPLKLRVGRSIYFARGFHILLFLLPYLCCSLSPCLVVHLVLFVSLLDLSVNLLFHWVIIWTSSCSPPPRPKATAGVSKICSLSVGKCFQQKLMWLRMFIPNRRCHWQLQTKAYWMQ